MSWLVCSVTTENYEGVRELWGLNFREGPKGSHKVNSLRQDSGWLKLNKQYCSVQGSLTGCLAK